MNLLRVCMYIVRVRRTQEKVGGKEKVRHLCIIL